MGRHAGHPHIHGTLRFGDRRGLVFGLLRSARGAALPGEDFLSNLPAGVMSPVDLAEGSSLIVLTIEPDLGGVDPTGDGPFSIKPLLAMVSAGAADHASIGLVRDRRGPSGTASF